MSFKFLPKRFLPTVGLLALALTVLGTNGASAFPSAPTQAQRATSAADTAQGEVESYSREFGLSYAQAAMALKTQDDMHPLKAAVNALVGEAAIEVRTVHLPVIHLEVIVTPSAPTARVKSLLESSGFQYSLEVADGPSRAALVSIARARSATWVKEFPEIQGIGTDPQRSAISIDAVGDSQDLDSLRSKIEAEISDDSISVITNSLPGPLQLQTRGGLPAFNASGTPLCTLGFSVRSTVNNARGVSSAGHCENGNGMAFYQTFESNQNRDVNLADRRFNGSTDLSWYTISGTAVGQFYPAKGSPARTVTGTLGAADMDGDSICHRGRSTDQSCGFVDDTSYQPAGNCPGGCDNTYVSVKGQFLKCSGGDSGGPWYGNTTAYGNHVGGTSFGVGSGDCDLAYFTPGRRFSTMNMEILVP